MLSLLDRQCYYCTELIQPWHLFRWLYWSTGKRLERVSMDGNNRTVLISNLNSSINSFTLDYQTQVLYLVFFNQTLKVTSANIDGTIIRQQQIPHYSSESESFSSLHIHKTMLYLSLWNREVFTFGTGGENFTTFTNSSVHCFGQYRHLKIVSEEQQPQSKFGSHCYLSLKQ